MTKIFKRAENNKHLEKLIEAGLGFENIAATFGVSTGAAKAWITGDRACPYWTKIAAEGIIRRMGGTKQATLLVRCPQEQEHNILAIVTSLGATVTQIKL